METILYTIVICQSLKMCICASYYDNVIDNDFESSLSIAVDLSVGPVQHNDTNIHIVGGHRGALCDGGCGCIQFISIVGIRHISRYLDTRGMTRCQASTRARYHGGRAPWQSSPLTLMVFCSLACAAPGPESGAPPVSQSNYHQDNLNQITRQDISHMWTLSRGRQLASDL